MLTDKFGKEIRVGDTLLYPHRSGASAGDFAVLTVTAIKIGKRRVNKRHWDAVRQRYFWHSERIDEEHLSAIDQNWQYAKPQWVRYPERGVVVSGLNLAQRYGEAEDEAARLRKQAAIAALMSLTDAAGEITPDSLETWAKEGAA